VGVAPLNNRTAKAPLDAAAVDAGRNARLRETALSRESSLRTDTDEVAARGIPPKLPKNVSRLRDVVLHAVEDMKGREPVEIDIRDKASFADLLVIVSGTSTRHVRSIAGEVAKQSKTAGFAPIGVEGEREGEWVLDDVGAVAVASAER
jgi:ribosome silencing factor RsfS/YbeB/iojap